MQHIQKRRRPNRDVFGDVEEAQPEELRAAGVIYNLEIQGAPIRPKKAGDEKTMDSDTGEETEFIDLDQDNDENDEDSEDFDPTRIQPVSSRPRKRNRPSGPHKSQFTTVTPTIHALVSPFCNNKFKVVGERPSFLDEEMLERDLPPKKVSQDDTTYQAGDFVIVNEDFGDESTERFAQILFFDYRKKNFHARWFIHGSKTILGDLAHAQELFLSTAEDCKDVSADCVVSKCDVVKISLAEFANQSWPATNSYFYSSAWDSKRPADFTEVTDDQVCIPSSRICPSCETRDTPTSYFKSSIRSIIKSTEYHSLDFIRYEASDSTQLTCSIGQIISFLDSDGVVKVTVQRLGRERDKKGPGCVSELALYLTSESETVDANSVFGICQVLHVSEYEIKDHTWIDAHPDCFYVKSQARTLGSSLTPLPLKRFIKCQVCYLQEENNSRLRMQCKAARRLTAFDPFAGIGGFGLGLGQGCSMYTSVGIEIDPSTAEAMRRNFPAGTAVLNADANEILRDLSEGRRRELGLTRGRVDLIYSGPPCQNESALNRHKTDLKRPALTLLSFVDLLRPAFFIMESVPGILRSKFLTDIGAEIKAINLKCVLRVLHFLGYNITGQMMHARSFGVPQTRDRLFIVGTLPVCGRFQFPEVTHAFKQEFQSPIKHYRIDTGLKFKNTIAPGRALHEVVTVAEALSDLPFFDWKPPKKLTAEQAEEGNVRAKIIPTLSCPLGGVWGIQDIDFEYSNPSANVYQQRARRDLVLCAKKKYQHYTMQFPLYTVQNVCDVPFTQGADYRHLDQRNRERCLRDPASAKAIAGYQSGAYTRLDPDGYFHTIITQVGPVSKQSCILHPFCKRILTVRELARAQGFPDDIAFYSDTDSVKDYHQQIGNSIPFGVSAALGRSLQDLVFKAWLKENGRTESS